MTILEETRELVQEKIGRDGDALVVEKAVIGLFSTVANLSNGVGGM